MNQFAEFLLGKGLYDSIVISQDNIQDLIDLTGGKVRINCFCKECGDSRTFSMKPIECTRNKTKNAFF